MIQRKKKYCGSRTGGKNIADQNPGRKNIAAPDPELWHELPNIVYLITVFYFVFFEGSEVLQSFPLSQHQ